MICSFAVLTSDTKGRLKKSTFLVSGTFSRLSGATLRDSELNFLHSEESVGKSRMVCTVYGLLFERASHRFFFFFFFVSRTNHVSVWVRKDYVGVFHLADIAPMIIRSQWRADRDYDAPDALNSAVVLSSTRQERQQFDILTETYVNN